MKRGRKMKKKEYQKPEINVIEIETEDIITTSVETPIMP